MYLKFPGQDILERQQKQQPRNIEEFILPRNHPRLVSMMAKWKVRALVLHVLGLLSKIGYSGFEGSGLRVRCWVFSLGPGRA